MPKPITQEPADKTPEVITLSSDPAEADLQERLQVLPHEPQQTVLDLIDHYKQTLFEQALIDMERSACDRSETPEAKQLIAQRKADEASVHLDSLAAIIAEKQIPHHTGEVVGSRMGLLRFVHRGSETKYLNISPPHASKPEPETPSTDPAQSPQKLTFIEKYGYFPPLTFVDLLGDKVGDCFSGYKNTIIATAKGTHRALINWFREMQSVETNK